MCLSIRGANGLIQCDRSQANGHPEDENIDTRQAPQKETQSSSTDLLAM